MGDAKKMANHNIPTIRRTSISEAGKVTEKQVSLKSLMVRQEAIDLSAGTNLPATLLVTREAAMKITEKAISSALENAWSDLLKEQQQIPISVDNNKTGVTATPAIGNSQKAHSAKASSLKGDPIGHKTMKRHNKPLAHSKKGAEISAGQGLKTIDPLQLQLHENNVSLQEPETVQKKPKVESKSSPAMGTKKQTPRSITKKSASSPSHIASKKKGPKIENANDERES